MCWVVQLFLTFATNWSVTFRLLYPWDFRQNTGVGCNLHLQGIFPTYPWAIQRSPLLYGPTQICFPPIPVPTVMEQNYVFSKAWSERLLLRSVSPYFIISIPKTQSWFSNISLTHRDVVHLVPTDIIFLWDRKLRIKKLRLWNGWAHWSVHSTSKGAAGNWTLICLPSRFIILTTAML